MIKINMQFFGGNGASSKKAGAGGGKSNVMTEQQRIQVVQNVEKAVKSMKAPTGTKDSTLEIEGLNVRISRVNAIKGNKYCNIKVFTSNGDEVYDAVKDSWAQAKDALYQRLPGLAVFNKQH